MVFAERPLYPATTRAFRPRELVVHGAVLSLVLGTVTGIIWLLVGGREASQGGFLNVARDDGVLLYGALALASGAIGYLIGRGPWHDRSLRPQFVVIAFAWLVDGVILVVFGRLLAGELHPPVAALAWLVATGAGLQPVAASAGAWFAATRRRQHQRTLGANDARSGSGEPSRRGDGATTCAADPRSLVT